MGMAGQARPCRGQDRATANSFYRLALILMPTGRVPVADGTSRCWSRVGALLAFTVDDAYRHHVMRAALARRRGTKPGDTVTASPIQDYENAVASAKKALGKEGALPKPRVDPLKVIDEAEKSLAGFNKNRAEMEKTTIDVVAAAAKVKAAAKQYGDMVDGDDFGLDAKDPKNKKIIAEVTKTMLDGLKGIEDQTDWRTDTLDKLDKVLKDLRRLK
jgi:hypothetical protein